LTSEKPAAVEGLLKGYDALLNLVMDECVEHMEGAVLPIEFQSDQDYCNVSKPVHRQRAPLLAQ
jgi:small nuclear ribonucleoprotein (snRNP)-like protein